MKKQTPLLMLCLALVIALSGLSCSDDETEPSAESTAQTQEETPLPESSTVDDEAIAATGEEGTSEEFVLEDEDTSVTTDLAAAYGDECDRGKVTSLECEVLRSLLVIEVAMALEEIEQSLDQRGTEEALAALDLVDEPEILIAACRVLGRFPDTPGIAGKATPLLLDSPYLAVVQVAAQVLGQNSDPAVAAMARQWSSNHGVLWTDNPYELTPDFPEHYFDMGFPEYPDAEWFGPADSDRSVGWRVEGTPAKVSAWLAEELGVAALPFDQWSQLSSQEMMKTYQAVMDPAYTAELQTLMEQYLKNQDPAVAEKITKKQEEMDAVSKKIESDTAKSLNSLLSPPGGVAIEDLSYFVAEEKDGHVARAIMVYRYIGLEYTVMQMAWDLRDYPPAWPVRD